MLDQLFNKLVQLYTLPWNTFHGTQPTGCKAVGRATATGHTTYQVRVPHHMVWRLEHRPNGNPVWVHVQARANAHVYVGSWSHSGSNGPFQNTYSRAIAECNISGGSPDHVWGIVLFVIVYGITLLALLALSRLAWKLAKEHLIGRAPCQHCGRGTTYEGGTHLYCLGGEHSRCCNRCNAKHDTDGWPVNPDYYSDEEQEEEELVDA